ncbi:FMN-linked oxidoreductase [Gloeophyllum trabeum ATCC 11539]|uniref:FMN-linked oxidoreductase n=1 Tax=Gloeophyllum trabeum (strain ATCC 11539 / FP-39264 / Madison 617) TaxID=670483 RepID=S7PUX7_GLOTA|nr:FMN-linked oxidoreductase [Gloeophyllum trabeum ATCC 11539]EPQ51238.1 FMN-linked oxidoreductase [Gloeophyllum trabeum ATCC 11539]
MTAVPKLFQPTTLGPLALSHRVVLAPLSRRRASAAHVPGELAATYYAQRASVPGTLLISESTEIAAKAGGSANTPGIWSDEQVEGWKRVTDAVHARGSYIVCQLRAQGRAADPAVLAADAPGAPYVSSSPTPLSSRPSPPRALTIPEIDEYFSLYATAARNALKAGFDGVEVHAANGYLVDQFLQDVVNKREDAYGGSVERRCRFALEVVDAVVRVVGAERVGIRLSPWATFNDMRMPDPVPTFSHLVSSLRAAHPSLAYLHLVEPRADGIFDREPPPGESNDFIRTTWSAPGGHDDGRRIISAGGYTRALALDVAERTRDLVAFGRFFISNPDLPTRLLKNLPLAPYDRKTFYTPGPEGYTDYPFADAEDSPAPTAADPPTPTSR